MRRTDIFGSIAAIVAIALFLIFYLTGSIGSLTANLASIVDALVAGLFVACGSLIIGPRLWERREQAGMVDDLQNPEVRLRVQRAHKEEVSKMISTLTPEAQRALARFPSAKPFIEGLTLIDEKDANWKKNEARKALLRDLLMGDITGEKTRMTDIKTKDVVEGLMWSAIDLMTLPKGAKMLRSVESADEKGDTSEEEQASPSTTDKLPSETETRLRVRFPKTWLFLDRITEIRSEHDFKVLLAKGRAICYQELVEYLNSVPYRKVDQTWRSDQATMHDMIWSSLTEKKRIKGFWSKL